MISSFPIQAGVGNRKTPALALSVLLLIPAAPALSARTCQQGLTESTAIAAKAVDGDTLVLETGQRVRLIGMNTPEMNAKRSQDKHWAILATKALNEFVTGQRVVLFAGRDPKDRYKRLLAHVQLPDGRDAARTLIDQGLAVAVVVGRNNACAIDNIALENEARLQERGLWKDKAWHTASASLKVDRGFQLVRSTISRRSLAGKKTILTLTSGLVVKLGRHWPLSDTQTNGLLNEAGNSMIEVRGWIGGRMSAPQLTLHHPANLKIIAR